MTTRAKPFSVRPPRLTQAETTFYPHELERFDAIFWKDYSQLSSGDARFIINEFGHLPPAYTRYLAPALAEHARRLVTSIAGEWLIEWLTRLLKQVLTLEEVRPLVPDLRAALLATPADNRTDHLTAPEPLGARFPAGHCFARLLHYVLEAEGDTLENRSFLASNEPAAQLVSIELTLGVLESGWSFENPASSALFTLDAIIERLSRWKQSSDERVRLAARFVLGELSPDQLCRDPRCRVHRSKAG